VGLVEVLSDELDAFLVGRGICIAGVEVVEFDTKLLAACQVVEERIVGLLLAVRVGVSKIDQIRAMWEATTTNIYTVLFSSIYE
jgi:hypothetical protein